MARRDLGYSEPIRRLLFCVALVVALPTTFTGPAHAQDDGVFIDPSGPTAKEYEIPLEAERRRGEGSARGNADVQRSDPVPGGADPAPPPTRFGRGVTPDVARSQTSTGSGTASRTDAAQAKGAGGAGLPAVARLERQGSSPTWSMLLVAAAILGLALAGVEIRRRRSLRP